MSSQGVKETKEAVSGALKLGTLLYKKFADGVQTQDFMEIFAKFQLDAEFQKAIVEAYNGANLIEAELKDMDLAEGLEVAMHSLAEVQKAIVELKK